MATKTIPQLQEETDINGETLFAIDTGTQTFKIKAKNFLQARMKYKAILGSVGQVTANLATHSSWATMLAAVAAGDCVRILPGTWVEDVVIDKQLQIEGSGYGSYIDGALDFQAVEHCTVEGLRVNDDITLDEDSNGNIVKNMFLPSGKSFIDNGEGNLLEGIQE